jgi:hypothetical protein
LQQIAALTAACIHASMLRTFRAERAHGCARTETGFLTGRAALAVRLLVAWLSVLLAIGLWQGYGPWLLSLRVGDVF